MKRYILTAIAALLVLSSCTHKTVGGFGGNYSFKTGGDITIDDADKTTLALPSESGQMDILPDGEKWCLITMNILNGGALVLKGTLADGSLNIASYKRTIDFNTSSLTSLKKTTANVTVTGKAQKIENVIVFDLKYTGTVKIDDETYKITSSNVHQIAKEN